MTNKEKNMIRLSLIILVITLIYLLFKSPIIFLITILLNIWCHYFVYKILGKEKYKEIMKLYLNVFKIDK